MGVTFATLIASQVFEGYTIDSWKVAGMLAGTYSGGTSNMAAIGLSLGIMEDTFILLNTADLLFCSIYLIFLMTFAKRFLGRFLPDFKNTETEDEGNQNAEDGPFSDSGLKRIFYSITRALFFSVLVLGIAVGLSYILAGEIRPVIVILAVTTLGIAGSSLKSIRNYQGTYESGEYLLLVFCIAIGSQVDFMELFNTSSVLFYYVGLVISLSIVIHFILAAIFRIDVDTVIITSTAAILGPATVGAVADSLKNRYVLVSGLATGLIGFATGTYLGLGIAYMLKP